MAQLAEPGVIEGTDDDEKQISEYGNYECTFRAVGKESMYLMMKNSKSKRSFANSFSISTLAEMGLKTSIDKILQLLNTAKSDEKSTSFEVRFGDSKNDKHVPMDKLSKSYEKGYALFICVSIISVLDSRQFLFKLLEKQRTETDILRDIISDMQAEIAKTNQKYGGLEQKYDSAMKELKDLGQKYQELKKKSQLELGSWQSSADLNKVKRWNHVIIAPTVANLFRMEQQNSKIVVLKSGIYHIRGDACVTATHWTGYVKVNGQFVSDHVQSMHTGSYSQFAFDVTRRLNVNDYIEIYVNHASYNNQRHNTLTIQRMSD